MVLLYNFANATQELYLDKGTSGLDALATMRYQDGLKVRLSPQLEDLSELVLTSKYPSAPQHVRSEQRARRNEVPSQSPGARHLRQHRWRHGIVRSHLSIISGRMLRQL